MSKIKFFALNDFVIIEAPVPHTNMTVPDRTRAGVVVSGGKDPQISAGDVVHYRCDEAVTIRIAEENFIVVRESQILCVEKKGATS